jgi:hypothetical protein
MLKRILCHNKAIKIISLLVQIGSMNSFAARWLLRKAKRSVSEEPPSLLERRECRYVRFELVRKNSSKRLRTGSPAGGSGDREEDGKTVKQDPTLEKDLEKLIEPVIRGDPENPFPMDV